MMKKLLTMALSITLIATLTACGAGTSAAEADSGGTAGETAATGPETGTAEAATTERAEWSLNEIAGLGDIVTGITDREYGAGEGSTRKIREDITYDREFIHTVSLNTASVRFDTPGEYPMTYWVYFDAAALSGYVEELNTGLIIPDAGRLAVAVYATVTVTEAVGEETEADGEAEATDSIEAAAGTSGSITASSGGSGSTKSASSNSSKSNSSGGSGSSTKSSGSSVSSSGSGSSSKSSGSSSSSGSSTSSCDHAWVEVTEEVDVREGRYVCKCGFSTKDPDEIAIHCTGELNPYSFESVVVGTQTVGTGTYVCSKCGATK